MEYAPPSEVVWIPESSFEVLAKLVRWARSDFIARRLACDEVALLLLRAEQSFAFQYRFRFGQLCDSSHRSPALRHMEESRIRAQRLCSGRMPVLRSLRGH